MQISLAQALGIALAAYLSTSVWFFGVGYFTVYRPLIAGTIVGLILGDVRQGMLFGAALNAVHLGFISTGGSLPSDLATAGYMGTALALASGLDVEAALAAFGIPLGMLGGFLWFGRMTLGSGIVRWADARAEKGDARGVAAINLWAGQGMLFLFYAVPTFIIVYYGQQGMDRLLALIPQQLIVALSVVGGMLPAVGIGLLLRSMGRWRLVPYFIVGFLLVTYFDLPIPAVALLGLSAAWLGANKAHPADEVHPADAETRFGVPPTDKVPPAGFAPVGSHPAVETRRERRLPRRVLWGAWWRWAMFLHASYNYERLQGLGFAHTMMPVIEHLYKTPEERASALKRHLAFFNTEPQIGALTPGVVISMEEERAAGADISDQAIGGVKSGLMGPLAGVGDSLFQGVITPLLLSLGIGLAQEGNLAGPVLYAILISATVLGTSYGLWSLGYRLGRAVVTRILASGWLQAVTEVASVTGMTVIGGLTATIVTWPIPVSLQIGQAVVSLQADVLDPILRGLLPLTLTAGVWWLLSRRVPSMQVIGLLFVLGIDLTYLGLAGWSSPPLFSREWLTFLVGGGGAALAVNSAAGATDGILFRLGLALMHLWPPLLATGLAAVTIAFPRRPRRSARG